MTAAELPVMSVSIAEEEVKAIGTEYLKDQLTAWNYYQTLDSPANAKFVAAFKAKYGDDSVTSDPMEAAYVSVYMWKMMVEKAKSFGVEDVKAAAEGVTMDAPEGTVTMDGENHHLYKTGRIGVVNSTGLIDEVWNSGEPIKPDPFLKGYDWASGLS
jgi:urea transport system substrate-binding protein